ncbi:MAG TPA: OB-fold nucleic acid binding domain-containing protein, partial [Candidatus Udaeobacter sp.]|nr:OB-fold nucleic acid binding domain-containing protein [Candidatus Udaeobacter sp.]
IGVSEWDCTLEPCHESAGGFAVRMGLRYVKGLGEREWQNISQARHVAPFVSLEDFVGRTTLDEGDLSRLAEAGAFESLGADRRSALWNIGRLVRTRNDSLSLPAREVTPAFQSLTAFEEVGWDYRTTSHSPRRHPLEPLRPALIRQGLPDARTVASMKNGESIRYAGLVICRQRPGTASGVVFMTLEDETGFVNAVVWESVFNQYSVLAKSINFLGITGKLQVEDGVVHLVAEKFWEPKAELRPAGAGSRDFH